MASFNRVVLMGNLTRDPEVRYTTGGTAVTDVSLAINRYRTDKNTNQRIEETTFVEVTLWGRTAEIAGEYLSKGRPVLIEGRLQQDQWEDKETGQKRTKLKVVGESMQLLSGRDGGGGGGGAPQSAAPQSAAPQSAAPQSAAPQSAPAQRPPEESFYDSPPSNSDGDSDVPF
jgi:single-strand DNA-binding protein